MPSTQSALDNDHRLLNPLCFGLSLKGVTRLFRRTFVLLSLLLLTGDVQGQAPSTPDAPPQAMGVNTGGTHAPVLDSEKRPITAGGFVKTGPVVFQDIAAKAGLTTWHHTMGSPSKKFIVEATGSGVALLDYDQDGWLDIYMVNGSTFDAQSGKAPAPHAALFHNNHDGTFTDVTEKAGVTNERWGFGVAVGDYDNDGWPDLYVSNFGKNRLYHNNHDGTFTDVAEKAGVTLGNWSTGASFGDYDGDGLLDLFVFFCPRIFPFCLGPPADTRFQSSRLFELCVSRCQHLLWPTGPARRAR